jgi:hypothetical protein
MKNIRQQLSGKIQPQPVRGPHAQLRIRRSNASKASTHLFPCFLAGVGTAISIPRFFHRRLTADPSFSRCTLLHCSGDMRH